LPAEGLEGFLKEVTGRDSGFLNVFAKQLKTVSAILCVCISIYPLLADVSELIAEEPEGELKDAIDRDFGSLDEFKKQFKAAGATQFGSGWAWLTKGKDGKLKVRHVSVTQALSILVRRMHVDLLYLEMSEAQQGEKLSWPCLPYSMTPIHAAAAAGPGLRRQAQGGLLSS